FLEELVEPRKKGPLLRRRTAELAIAPHGQQIEVNAGYSLGIAKPQHRGDKATPIAALDTKAPVAEHIPHQHREEIGDLLDSEPSLSGLEGKRISGQRRRNDGELLRQQPNQLVEFKHRSRPAVRDEQRQRIGASSRLVDEVQIDAANRHRKLAKA